MQDKAILNCAHFWQWPSAVRPLLYCCQNLKPARPDKVHDLLQVMASQPLHQLCPLLCLVSESLRGWTLSMWEIWQVPSVFGYCTELTVIIIIIYPVTERVVGTLFSTSLWNLANSRPVHSLMCLPTTSSLCLVFFPLSLCLARWLWPDLMNGRHDHTTAVCISLWLSGGLPHGLCMRCIGSCGSSLFSWLVKSCILLWSSAVMVHDSQAYRKMDVTREHISSILELREILLHESPSYGWNSWCQHGIAHWSPCLGCGGFVKTLN